MESAASACHSGDVSSFFVGRVGQITKFDQCRGNIGRLKDLEAGLLVRDFEHLDRFPHLLDQAAGQYNTKVPGFAAGQIQENVGNLVPLLGIDVNPSQQISERFSDAASSAAILFRRLLGHGIDNRTANRTAAEGVGVDGHEQVGPGVTCDPHPLPQPDKHVAFPGADDSVAAAFGKFSGEHAGKLKKRPLFPMLRRVHAHRYRCRHGRDPTRSAVDHGRLAAGSAPVRPSAPRRSCAARGRLALPPRI